MPRSEWGQWSDLLGLFVATGYIQGELAQSILLVGDPGSGKSALIGRFHHIPSAMVAMDATAEGLKQQVFPKMIADSNRHLLLPDMYKLMQRRGPTADNTIGVLTQAMSGEMHDSYIGEKQRDRFPEGFQIGVVGGMPTKVFQDWSQTITNTGLLSRMFPVPFVLSREMQRKVQLAIATEDRSLLAPVRFSWPRKSLAIGYSRQLGPRVIEMARIVGGSGQQNRLTQLLVSLVKAAAFLEGDAVCRPKHAELVSQFLPLLRGEKPRSA